MLQTIMLVDVIDPYHFLSMLQTKKLVDVKIFDLNTPTRKNVLSQAYLKSDNGYNHAATIDFRIVVPF